MSTVQDIYNVNRAPGQLAFGYFSQQEILSNTIDANAYSGQFLTFSSSTPGEFTPIVLATQSSARVIGMFPFLPEYPSSSSYNGASSYPANTCAPYVKQANLVYVKTNVNVNIGDQVYIDIANSTASLCGNVTNVSTGNVTVPTAVFEQSVNAGSLVLISFNLPN